MREWEKISREDLETRYKVKLDSKDDLLKLHKGLKEACLECGEGGDLEGADEIDDEIIAIEIMLEKEHGVTEFGD